MNPQDFYPESLVFKQYDLFRVNHFLLVEIGLNASIFNVAII
jgi:hypothetical protein